MTVSRGFRRSTSEVLTTHGASQDCIDRCRPDWRHARHSYWHSKLGKSCCFEHREGIPQRRQGADPRAAFHRRGLRRAFHRAPIPTMTSMRCGVHRDRWWRPRKTGDDARTIFSAQTSRCDGAGRRRHSKNTRRALRDMHHQPVDAHGVGVQKGCGCPSKWS